MPVRLNITIDEDLYRRLKKELPPKGISSFIEASVRARLFPGRPTLRRGLQGSPQGALAASLAADWAITEGEHWPR